MASCFAPAIDDALLERLFLATIYVLEVENQQLREQSQPGDTVRPIPNRRRPQPVR